MSAILFLKTRLKDELLRCCFRHGPDGPHASPTIVPERRRERHRQDTPAQESIRTLHFTSSFLKFTLKNIRCIKVLKEKNFNQIAPMVGMADVNTDMMSSKLEETLNIIKKVNQQFKNPVTFFPFLVLDI